MSEERTRAAHHVEDLSVLARRGALSDADKQAFTDALGASATLATAHQLGLDFDQVAAVKPGDDTLIAEAAARAVGRGHPAGLARFRLRALLLAATLALAGSATAFWHRTRTAAVSMQPSAPARPAAVAARAGALTPATAVAELSPAPAAAPKITSAPGRRPALVNAPAGALPAPSRRAGEPLGRAFDSAESLFREANAARRSGEQAAARALYLRLEHDFPASDEASLAHLSLGNLLLSMGRPAEAERQFAAYLGGRPALVQEALVGRAQSLAALGRDADEQRIWEGLLRDYPSSVYAGRAKQRLAELARSE